jgi:transposase
LQEVLGRERRRRWRADEKAEIVAESFLPDVSVSWVARRHGISPSQLFGWRKAAKQKGKGAATVRGLIPVVVTDGGEARPANEAKGEVCSPVRVEIAFPNGRRLLAPAELDRRLLDQLVASVAHS